MDRISLSIQHLSVTSQVPGRPLFVLIAIALLAGCTSDRPNYELLFGPHETPLAPDDRAAIFAIIESWFPLSSDGSRFEDPNCGAIPVRAEVVDLNSDGAHEVFVIWGNACTSGAAGSSLSMFARDSSANYQDQFGFPASGYTALPSSNDGYPDLQFGGPGFCFAVWSWNGSDYEFKCNAPQDEGGCQSTGNVCQTL